MEDFKRLSDIVGIDNMGWRYDPIFMVTDDTSILIPAFVTAFFENALTTNPVNVSGIEIDKIVFSDSIQSVEGKTSNSDFDYWHGDKIRPEKEERLTDGISHFL